MLRENKGIMVMCVCVWIGLTACLNKRGALDDRTFFSTHYPNIKIEMSEDFTYQKGDPGSYKHQFFNEEAHRYIFIHYQLHVANEGTVDYYENPERWIYSEWPDTTEIEKGRMEILGKNWYFRDSVCHTSTASCAMIRDLGLFTYRHDVLKMLYVRELPPYTCGQWKSASGLTEAQTQYRKEFLDDFDADVTITNYPLD